jgi:hypothetical protein
MISIESEPDLKSVKNDIYALWNRNFSLSDSGRYAWMYENNPNGLPALWIAKTEAGDTIGAAGLAPGKMKIGAHILSVGQAIDLAVDRKHRGASLALRLQKAVVASLEKNGFSLIYAFPNDKSELILLRAGYRILGAVERWTKPLRFDQIVNSVVKWAPVAKVGSILMNAASSVLSHEFRYKRAKGIRTGVQEEFDHRVHALWEKASTRYEMIGVRTSEYLAWRFGKGSKAHKMFCLSDDADGLLGYVIFNVMGSAVNIEDFLAADDDRLDSLLAEFAIFAREDGAASISVTFVGSRETEDRLRRCGFYRRPQEGKALVYMGAAINDGDRERMMLSGNWFLTVADRDV